jgi:tRNA pseudouridine32 synthase/23S rRNA pseudouridine746 synthase
VRGRPPADSGRIELPLDGQAALTRYRVSACDATAGTCTLEVETDTGRKHQIRRHLALLGVPVIGDPRYGRGNKDPGGLRLTAHRLAFRCPFSGQPVEFAV